jgi:hypothetical protein
MLIFGLGIGLIVAGIVALVRGRLQFSKTKAVVGAPARVLGAALITPLPVSFLVAIIYTMTQIDPNRPDQAKAWAKDNELTITAIQAGTMIGLAVLIIVIAAFLAKPIEARRPSRRDEYDDYEQDDRPRRPRRDERADDEDDDRPRRRRHDDYDDRAR